MSIFLGGAAPSDATASARIAAIKAVLLSSTYFKTATEAGMEGIKYVDSNALMEYLRTELLSISTTDGTPPDPALCYQYALQTDLAPSVEAWARVVANPGNTGGDQILTVAEATSRIKTLRTSLVSLSTQITDYYTTTRDALVASSQDEYDRLTPDYMPEIVVRTLDTRAYIYTYVNDWGWESAPSPPSDVITVDQNDIVDAVAAAPPTARSITKIRLYRSNSGSSGAAFQFAKETAVAPNDTYWVTEANRTFNDTLKTTELQEVCETTTWIEPPSVMKGIKAMPNGVIIGFSDNQLYFCEPFVPYAWPLNYRLTTEHKIVGIGVFGQTAVVLTEGFPYYVSGADSATMSAQKMEFAQACIAKRTIVTVDGGVVYASPDGLCLATSGGISNILTGAFDRQTWRTFIGTGEGAFAGFHEGIYYVFNAAGAGYAIDVESKKISSLVRNTSGLYSDLLTDKLYVVSGTDLLDLFGGAGFSTGVWKSRPFIVSNHAGFGCLRVESDFEAAVTIKLFGDHAVQPYHTATFTSRSPQRLPAKQFREIEIQIEAACPVTRVTMATSMQELATV